MINLVNIKVCAKYITNYTASEWQMFYSNLKKRVYLIHYHKNHDIQREKIQLNLKYDLCRVYTCRHTE